MSGRNLFSVLMDMENVQTRIEYLSGNLFTLWESATNGACEVSIYHQRAIDSAEKEISEICDSFNDLLQEAFVQARKMKGNPPPTGQEES